MRLRRSVHPYLVLILIAAPFLLWAMLLIMPVGGFLMLGCLIAAFQFAMKKMKAKEEAK